MVKRSEKTVRKWIIGGCRKCREAAENHARGLCSACEWEARTNGTIGQWPKIGPESLAATRDEAERRAAGPGLAAPAVPGVLEFGLSQHDRVRNAVKLVLEVCEQRAMIGERLTTAQLAGFIAASLPSLMEG